MLVNERGQEYLFVQPEEALSHMPRLVAGYTDPPQFLQSVTPDMVGLIRKDQGVVRYAAVLQGHDKDDVIWWLNVAGAESGTPDVRRWLWDHGVRRMRAVIRYNASQAWKNKMTKTGYTKIGAAGPESDTYEWLLTERP